MKSLLVHASAAGIKVENVSSLDAVWTAHCREMPAVLLASGLSTVLKRWTNTFCLPAPGEVWKEIEPELNRMRGDLATMESAKRQTDAATDDPEDRGPSAETEAVIAETLRVLRAAGQRKRAA